MNTIIRVLFLPAFTLLIFFMVLCSSGINSADEPNNRHSGGTGQDVTTVYGFILSPEGKPAPNVSVIMRSADYLPANLRMGKRKGDHRFFACSTRTSFTGYYQFRTADSIPKGKFTIEARDSAGYCTLLGNECVNGTWFFNNSDLLPRELSGTLKPPSAIRGTIKPPEDQVKLLVCVVGLDRWAEVNAKGEFVIENLPEGVHRLQFTKAGINKTYSSANVETHAGDTATLKDGALTVEGVKKKITFQKTFGGSGVERGCSVQQTHEGEFVIAGTTSSFGSGGSDVYLVKTTGSGEMQWEKTFGGASSDGGIDMRLTLDKGYIIAGYSLSVNDGKNAVYLIKTDKDGNAAWQRIFQGFQGGVADEYGCSVQQTVDGGFIITGYAFFTPSLKSSYLIRTDPEGNLIRRLWEGGFSIQNTFDGGFMIANSYSLLSSSGPENVYLAKIDAEENIIWRKYFGDEIAREVGCDMQQTVDGGFVVAGIFFSPNSYASDVFIIKTDTDGNEIWTKTYGSNEYDDCGYSIQQTSDGGFVISGKTYSSDFGVPADVLLIKTDADGNEIWTRVFGGTGEDVGYSVKQTADGGFVIAGYTDSFGSGDSDLLLIKTDENGMIETTQ